MGTVAGLRSMTAPAAVLLATESIWAGPVAFAAVGEAIVDKLPFAPARLRLPHSSPARSRARSVVLRSHDASTPNHFLP